MSSRLVNRNVTIQRGRTSMRLEPELWDALHEVCARERTSMARLVQRIEQGRGGGGRTSAVRVHLVNYFRAAAAGHHAGDSAGRPPSEQYVKPCCTHTAEQPEAPRVPSEEPRESA